MRLLFQLLLLRFDQGLLFGQLLAQGGDIVTGERRYDKRQRNKHSGEHR
ncbi:MAG: hypothetical protein OEM01_00765 [Desulfobulbaceae bacterium]|nr:hypothetical protein [Desulfobulbaceae bacterium]